LSPAFRATRLAHFFANLFTERNEHADLQTILHQLKALQQPEPEGHHERIACPTIILTGSEDGAHRAACSPQHQSRQELLSEWRLVVRTSAWSDVLGSPC
jgi:pimeloyl-ACP methyl ester carboxylesterase